MAAAGRLGDKSIAPLDIHGCPACPHPVAGPAVSGSPTVNINKKPALRVGDRGVHSACCGPNTWDAIVGSATVFIDGKPAHRVGDMDMHCGGVGLLAEGSPNVFSGGPPQLITGAIELVKFEVEMVVNRLVDSTESPSIDSSSASHSAQSKELAKRAEQVHAVLDPIAQARRTTAILQTSGGNIVASGVRDLTPDQRALLGTGEIAAKLSGAHAEVTALAHAQAKGLTPRMLAVTRPICPQCVVYIEATGGKLTSAKTAVWP